MGVGKNNEIFPQGKAGAKEYLTRKILHTVFEIGYFPRDAASPNERLVPTPVWHGSAVRVCSRFSLAYAGRPRPRALG